MNTDIANLSLSSPPDATEPSETPSPERPVMEVDIACAGFGPAAGGFLTTLQRAIEEHPEASAFQSAANPGMPLQVVCYERADDIASGVSGIVTRARGIRSTFPDLNPGQIPMAAAVTRERLLYLMDPIGASRRSMSLRWADRVLRTCGRFLGVKNHAFEFPWVPRFLHKKDGLILSIGQFNQWVGSQLMSSGLVQIWPGAPVTAPLLVNRTVIGLRLADQGVDNRGMPAQGYLPGMDVRARLTVVGDGPVGAVGQALDRELGMPAGHAHGEWALGMKMVIELPPSHAGPDSPLQPGTVWHTVGYPEPEIFGFLYVHPGRLVSVGIFVPSWMHNPSRTAYRYLQHYIQHPALWPHLKDGTLRSWGAKSLEESGRLGEPFLCGNGFARIGEGSGSTNMLTGSGVDEAWTTGVQLAESVIELLRAGKDFTQANLEETYVARRRDSWVERGARDAEQARAGFEGGLVKGLVGMALAGLTGGTLSLSADRKPAHAQIRGAAYTPDEFERHRAFAIAQQHGLPFHDALLSARGWPEIPLDGRLLVSQQDALLTGGKVHAAPGFADHVRFNDIRQCASCDEKTCIAMCSGQAITLGPDNIPAFEREKCIHCGACLWNCAKSADGQHSNIKFRAGSGGLHSAEN